MLIHDIITSSRVNGPGQRFVVWTQGCSRNCPGCFNPETHGTAGMGFQMDEQMILSLVPIDCRAITVSGGEPFDQSEDLARLLALAHSYGLHTLVYTGYTLEELKVCTADGLENSVSRCLDHIDILIDGPYIQEIPPQQPWTGSGNQKIHYLTREKENHTAETDTGSYSSAEITITCNGTIQTTGILDGHELEL